MATACRIRAAAHDRFTPGLWQDRLDRDRHLTHRHLM